MEAMARGRVLAFSGFHNSAQVVWHVSFHNLYTAYPPHDKVTGSLDALTTSRRLS